MAFNFDDASLEHVSYGTYTKLDGLETISGHAWVKLDDISVDHGVMSLVQSSNRGFFVWFDKSGGNGSDLWTVFFSDGTQVRVESPASYAEAGKWTCLSFSIDTGAGGVLDFYVDGVKLPDSGASASALGGFYVTGDAFRVGSTYGAGTSARRYMDGSVAEVSLWTRVLSEAEHFGLASGRSSDFYPRGRIFYDPLDSLQPRNRLGTERGNYPTTTPEITTDHPKIIRLWDDLLIGSTTSTAGEYTPGGEVPGPGGGGLPKINGITSYTSLNGVSSFTSINGVT